MRLLALPLALLLVCTYAQAQNDESDFDLNGDTCYQNTLFLDAGSCGEIKMDVGFCADSEEIADARTTLTQAFMDAELEPPLIGDCNDAYLDLCGSADKIKATSCDVYCDVLKVGVGVQSLGCQNDDQCPSSDDDQDTELGAPPPIAPARQTVCCSTMRNIMGDACSFSDSELDGLIASRKNQGECADSDCYSSGAHAMASVATSLIMSAFALIVMSRI